MDWGIHCTCHPRFWHSPTRFAYLALFLWRPPPSSQESVNSSKDHLPFCFRHQDHVLLINTQTAPVCTSSDLWDAFVLHQGVDVFHQEISWNGPELLDRACILRLPNPKCFCKPPLLSYHPLLPDHIEGPPQSQQEPGALHFELFRAWNWAYSRSPDDLMLAPLYWSQWWILVISMPISLPGLGPSLHCRWCGWGTSQSPFWSMPGGHLASA